jgi:hypothetical protein
VMEHSVMKRCADGQSYNPTNNKELR